MRRNVRSRRTRATSAAEEPQLRELAPGLRGRTPACWCAPEPGHADVRAEPAESGEADDVTPVS
ncbi:DUF4326 domain-containing protein [Streptomyces sp. NPDC051636]|uniref:DUF4326 domain-containing protein n=1 Tax=Streptomyces sp. NPDC051636 TaxID=3365663 RepID=UPI00378C5076